MCRFDTSPRLTLSQTRIGPRRARRAPHAGVAPHPTANGRVSDRRHRFSIDHACRRFVSALWVRHAGLAQWGFVNFLRNLE
jgi:hypothetical protein